MQTVDKSAIDTVLLSLSEQYKGPGGVAAVLKDGEVIAKQVWGYSDLEKRVPMSAATMMPICSVSKEFTCAALLDIFGEASVLDDALASYLPDFEGKRPAIADLCNNQSGLRDYWALTVISGADPEGVFTADDARQLLGKIRTTHFETGTHYSYNNGNFRLLSFLIEEKTGRSLDELLRERIFLPAGMKTAGLFPDTSVTPGDAIGYEGNIVSGFTPAVNNIHWSGDAGVCASLDDMIAWDQFIDATRGDENGIYNRLSRPQFYTDGKPACYGYGLNHVNFDNVKITGHGGALRGWRCQRFHAADARVSVIVMFNHQASAYGAAEQLMRAALGIPKAKTEVLPVDAGWYGNYFDPATKLSLSLTPAVCGQVHARFGTSPEMMDMQADGSLQSSGMVLQRKGDEIALRRDGENLSAKLHRVSGNGRQDIAGRYHCTEMDADFVCEVAGSAVYAAFEGFLGKGPMQPLYAIAEDIWLLPCQRGMDAPAPGDWTVVAERDASGAISGLTIGCWLARGIIYKKV
ncbi:D-aminopeptidase [Pseudochrobactrum lubricantis]|uniref:D-aminopeptidase n=1 Tax=Pseudochrobactrum lubricantis TaxID=558172 RepID=UPI0035E10F55